MTSFKDRLLETKRVSVWGIGYLGYTMLLKLQSKGFYADVFDFSQDRIDELMAGAYPLSAQKLVWSSKGEMPSLDLACIQPVTSRDRMFRNHVHIVCFPGRSDTSNYNRFEELANLFQVNCKNTHEALVLFQSAEIPGDIHRFFIDKLTAKGIDCACATMFRTDWSLEEYFSVKGCQVISGNNSRAYEQTRWFLNILGIEHASLASIREAEIYECTRKTLEHTISSFVNQVVLAYPDMDVLGMVGLMLREACFDDIRPSIGLIGYKSASATHSLMEGSIYPDRLTMIRDANAANISTILNYAEIARRQGLDSVTIMGICEKGDLKDIRMSSSLILAEHLIGQGVKVYLHDPYFTPEEIKHLLPEAKYIDIANLRVQSSCVFLMTDHRSYRYLSQKDLDRLGISGADLVIDNSGIWQDYRFAPQTVYHIPGDGKLEALEQ
jgi:UDP-N-acetyl-D-mannosaminuronate dehydrogenase